MLGYCPDLSNSVPISCNTMTIHHNTMDLYDAIATPQWSTASTGLRRTDLPITTGFGGTAQSLLSCWLQFATQSLLKPTKAPDSVTDTASKKRQLIHQSFQQTFALEIREQRRKMVIKTRGRRDKVRCWCLDAAPSGIFWWSLQDHCT